MIIHPFIGSCKGTCQALAFEDNMSTLTSLKTKMHIWACENCLRYYQQMLVVDEKIGLTLRKEETEKISQAEIDFDVDKLVETYAKEQ